MSTERRRRSAPLKSENFHCGSEQTKSVLRRVIWDLRALADGQLEKGIRLHGTTIGLPYCVKGVCVCVCVCIYVVPQHCSTATFPSLFPSPARPFAETREIIGASPTARERRSLLLIPPCPTRFLHVAKLASQRDYSSLPVVTVRRYFASCSAALAKSKQRRGFLSQKKREGAFVRSLPGDRPPRSALHPPFSCLCRPRARYRAIISRKNGRRARARPDGVSVVPRRMRLSRWKKTYDFSSCQSISRRMRPPRDKRPRREASAYENAACLR